MGATTTEMNAIYVQMNAVLRDMFDTINDVNMKSWVATDGELGELNTTVAAFTGAALPTNDTTAATGGGNSVDNASVGNVLFGTRVLATRLETALNSLREKNWTEFDKVTGPSVATEVAVVNGTLTSLSSSTPSTTQGADNVTVITAFTSSLRFKGVLDMIVPMITARRNKDYELVQSIHDDAMDIFGTFNAIVFTNNA